MFKLTLNVTNHPTIVKQLAAMDQRIQEMGAANAKEWWKKDLSATEVCAKHHPTCAHSNEHNNDTMKVKVFLPSPTSKMRPTEIYKDLGDGRVVRADHSVLTRGANVVAATVSAISVYFIGNDKFGVSFNADMLVVAPKTEASALEKAGLGKRFRLVDDDDAPPAKHHHNADDADATKKADNDDAGESAGESAM